MISIEKIGRTNIRKFYLNDAPYIKLEFGKKKLTDAQKELIYRIYFLHFIKEKYDPSYCEDVRKRMIRLVLLEKYYELCLMAIGNGIITTYLFANSLVENDDIFPYESRCIDNIPVSYYNYYISLLDTSILEKRPDIFVVSSFSKYVKYSNDFIDNNFKKFISNYEEPSFSSITVQKPPYDILVKHIEDIDIKDISYLTYLTEEQYETLKLLKSMDI